MQFTYTPEHQELRERAQRLTDAMIGYEEPCEQGRGLPDESLAEIRRLTLEHELNAINMPAEWGGQGLSVLDQVIVQERLGQLTNALWDAVWRPANALRHCTPAQRERYLIPAIKGERRDCFAVTEENAGSDPSLIETVAERDGDSFRISGEKWFVTVGDVADFLIVQAWSATSAPPRCSSWTRTHRACGQARAGLHAYLRLRASGVHLRRRRRRPRAGARRDRRWL